MPPELRACPFCGCGSSDLQIITKLTGSAVVECLGCGATGPSTTTAFKDLSGVRPAESVDEWLKRVVEKWNGFRGTTP